MNSTIIKNLIGLLNKSYSSFHAVENIKDILLDDGFKEIYEEEKWNIKKGGKYFVVRNDSSIIAFKVPKNEYIGFNIVASHSDSPCFKIKENGEIIQAGEYLALNTEKYGGMIMSTWLDRPISIAGRIIVEKDGKLATKLINIDKDLMIIPNMAIHMDRTINDGKKYNAQIDMLPLLGAAAQKGNFIKLIAEKAGVRVCDIVSQDLFLYVRQNATVLGIDDEFISGPRLDDLQCAYLSLYGFINSQNDNSVSVLAVFDNEEVGSGTKQGAASTFLYDTLTRINCSLGCDVEKYLKSLNNSFMISADNAHAVHPNNVSVSDPTNRPIINNGVVVKHNANQRYTTDAVSYAIFKKLAESVGVNVQSFTNRSDIMGGSTLGNISNTQVALNSVDVGLAQLAMHSCFETAGVKDVEDFEKICRKFYSITVQKNRDEYSLK